jgi:hypothetical protein
VTGRPTTEGGEPIVGDLLGLTFFYLILSLFFLCLMVAALERSRTLSLAALLFLLVVVAAVVALPGLLA